MGRYLIWFGHWLAPALCRIATPHNAEAIDIADPWWKFLRTPAIDLYLPNRFARSAILTTCALAVVAAARTAAGLCTTPRPSAIDMPLTPRPWDFLQPSSKARATASSDSGLAPPAHLRAYRKASRSRPGSASFAWKAGFSTPVQSKYAMMLSASFKLRVRQRGHR